MKDRRRRGALALVLPLALAACAGREKFGLTRTERQQVYAETVAAANRSVEEANAEHPALCLSVPTPPEVEEANQRLQERLEAEYKAAIVSRWRLTLEELDAVRAEGALEHWPSPPDSTPGC